jgi:transcriptional regulator with XRE-family HTH domain
MNNGKTNRKRGVVLTSRGWEKLHKAIDRVQARENHGVRYTFEELSDRTELTPRTVSRVLERKQRVDKPTLEQVFRAFNLELTESDYEKPVPNSNDAERIIPNARQDWGEAVDVSVFYGRTVELAELEAWSRMDDCL